jgi:DNA-binding MarR family transcriptional regulator
MGISMASEIPSDELLILQTMWEHKALGTHTMTFQDLATHLGAASSEITKKLERLEVQGLLIRTRGSRVDLFALSPLGAAFVRQLQDRQLGDLSRVS